MKFAKLLFPILLLSLLAYACAKQYEEPTGNVFEGTFVWRYSDTIKINKLVNSVDSLFIEVKKQEVLTYRNAARDTSLSYYYTLNKDNVADIYAAPLKNEEGVESAYKYFATYRFDSDTLFLETFALKTNGVVDKANLLIKRAYVRPKVVVLEP